MSTSENLRKLKQDMQASLSVNRRVDEWRKHETNESKLVNIINRSKNADILNNDISYTGGSLSSKESSSYTAPASCTNNPTNVWKDPTTENTFYSLFACDSSNKPPYGQNLCLDRTEVCSLWEDGWGYYDIGLNGGVREKFNGLLVPSLEKYMSLCASGDTNCQSAKTKLYFDHKKMYNEAWQAQLVNCMHTPTQEVNISSELSIKSNAFGSSLTNKIKNTEAIISISNATSLYNCRQNVKKYILEYREGLEEQKRFLIYQLIKPIYDYYTTQAVDCVYDMSNNSSIVSTYGTTNVYQDPNSVVYNTRPCTWSDRKLAILRSINFLKQEMAEKLNMNTSTVLTSYYAKCDSDFPTTGPILETQDRTSQE